MIFSAAAGKDGECNVLWNQQCEQVGKWDDSYQEISDEWILEQGQIWWKILYLWLQDPIQWRHQGIQ